MGWGVNLTFSEVFIFIFPHIFLISLGGRGLFCSHQEEGRACSDWLETVAPPRFSDESQSSNKKLINKNKIKRQQIRRFLYKLERLWGAPQRGEEAAWGRASTAGHDCTDSAWILAGRRSGAAGPEGPGRGTSSSSWGTETGSRTPRSRTWSGSVRSSEVIQVQRSWSRSAPNSVQKKAH